MAKNDSDTALWLFLSFPWMGVLIIFCRLLIIFGCDTRRSPATFLASTVSNEGVGRRAHRQGIQAAGRRRWRSLDLGSVKYYLEADAPRVACPSHGVVVAHVPWARPGARSTEAFDDTVAWLAAHAAFSVVAARLRVSWRTVAACVGRVVADLTGKTDRLAGLRRIGIDEIAHRNGHRYLTVVVDHDSGRLVWASPGRDTATVLASFDALGPDRSAELTHVSADGAEWIHTAVTQRAPQAVLGIDPFHVVAWATKALDEVRSGLWNDLRHAEQTGQAASLKGSRWALLKNPHDLTGDQRTSLAAIAVTNNGLYRAYLLKEQLRAVFATRGQEGRRLLAGWLSWAKLGVCTYRRIVTSNERISLERKV